MRSPRIKEAGAGYYHIISRVVDRRMVLTDIEKEHFSRLMRSVARFSGCQVLAHTVMTNHFHILLYVPEAEALDDAKLLARLRALYATEQMQEIACELRNYRRLGDAAAAERLRQLRASPGERRVTGNLEQPMPRAFPAHASRYTWGLILTSGSRYNRATCWTLR